MPMSSRSAVSTPRAGVPRSGIIAVLVALLSLLFTLAVAPGATAGTAAKTYRVQGIQVVVDEETGLSEMRSGDSGRPGLVGLWQNTLFQVRASGDDWYTATGTERFDGCLDRDGRDGCLNDPSGQLTFSFVLWVRFDPASPSYATIEGRCVHPITSGTGPFAGASGLLTMHDFRDEDGDLHTTYQGLVTLRGSGGATAATAQSADPSAERQAIESLGAVDAGQAAADAAPSFPRGC